MSCIDNELGETCRTGPTRPFQLIALGLACLAVACQAGDSADAWQGRTAQVGDTTVVTTTSGSLHGAATLDSIELVWRSDSLNRPTQVFLVGDGTLAVGDREQIFVLGPDGRVRTALGRVGDGPGEFRRIGSIGGRGDTIVGLDRENRHFSLFHADGRLLSSGILRPAGGLVNLLPGRIGFDAAGLLIGWSTFVTTDGTPGLGGVVLHLVGADSATVVRQVDGQPTVFSASGGAARATMFGPNPITAIGRDGRVAVTDGVEYCIDTRAASGSSPMRICRAWERVPVSARVRNPDFDAILAESGQPPETLAGIRELLPMITIPDRRNAIDWMFWDAEGRLWVMVVDAREAEVHPYLTRFTPNRMPSHRRWDVFDADGRLAWELTLPRSFMPTDAGGGRIYGILDTPEGDLAIASVRFSGTAQ